VIEVIGDPRVRRTRALVHEATIELLVDKGLSGLTIEAISQRAGVARTTIYRHWGRFRSERGWVM
jgi:AcrR family transcriptional regulator